MAQPLTDAINALTTYSNSVTGASDTTLSDAVATLASGYGGGGVSAEDSIIDGSISGTYENDRITHLKFAIFRGDTSLQHAKFPNVTNIDAQSFYGCTSLETLSLVKCTSTGGDAFTGCSKLLTLTIPSVHDILGSVAKNCTLLETADIKGGIVRGSAFENDASLTKVILRNTSVGNLVATSAFNGTPFASGGTGGTFYVPSALISSYQTTGNWATILGYANNQIKSIESTHTDPNAPIDLTLYYADGTPIE